MLLAALGTSRLQLPRLNSCSMCLLLHAMPLHKIGWAASQRHTPGWAAAPGQLLLLLLLQQEVVLLALLMNRVAPCLVGWKRSPHLTLLGFWRVCSCSGRKGSICVRFGNCRPSSLH